jgi:hypothetical protein
MKFATLFRAPHNRTSRYSSGATLDTSPGAVGCKIHLAHPALSNGKPPSWSPIDCMWAISRTRQACTNVLRPQLRRLGSKAAPIQPGETKAAEQAAANAASGGPFGWYRKLLIERPLVMNSLTAAGLGVAGDAAAQYAEFFLDITSPGKTNYNWKRTINMAAFGAIAGPVRPRRVSTPRGLALWRCYFLADPRSLTLAEFCSM